MTITFLGTGTSHGVPVIGCSCAVCGSDDPRNRRTRSSIWVRNGEHSLIVDTTPEFRVQALREGLDRLDAVFLTHPHADHLHGLDDLRSVRGARPLPVWGSRETIDEVHSRFSYIFRETQQGGGKPNITLREIPERGVEIGGIPIVPVPILHGKLPIYGFRIADTAYLTDCSEIPESSYELLGGLETLVIGALRYRPHATHFSISEALREIERIAPGRAYLTHLCHDIDHAALKGELPAGIEPAFDGLTVRRMSTERGEEQA